MASLADVESSLTEARKALRELLTATPSSPALLALHRSIRDAQSAVAELTLSSVEEEIRAEATEYKQFIEGLVPRSGASDVSAAQQALELLSGRIKGLEVAPLDSSRIKADMDQLAQVIQERADLADSIKRAVGTVVRVGKVAAGLI